MYPETLNPTGWAFERDSAEPSITECGGVLLLFEPSEVAELLELQAGAQECLAQRYGRRDGAPDLYVEAAGILRAAAAEVRSMEVGDLTGSRELAARFHALYLRTDAFRDAYKREAYGMVFSLIEHMLVPKTVFSWAQRLPHARWFDAEIRREAMLRIAAAARAADVMDYRRRTKPWSVSVAAPPSTLGTALG